MADALTTLRAVLDEIARRRGALSWRRGWTMGALAAAGVLLGVRLALALVAPTGAAFLALMAAGLLVATSALVLSLRGRAPASTPRQLARLLEERQGGLDDVVVSAIDYAERDVHQPAVAARLAAAALRAIGDAPADAVVTPAALTTAGRRALAAAVALVVALGLVAPSLWQAAQVASVYAVPSRLVLTVEPGNIRVRAGRPVTIRARVAGSLALTPSLVAGTGADAAPVVMTPAGDGLFEVTLPEVTATFGYHVVAGARQSDTFTVTVVHPARVERIDLDYAYPKALGLDPRHEADGGDIYAPDGTAVSLTITADRPVAASALVLEDGTRVPLGVAGRTVRGGLTVRADGSYRIAFVDDDGIEMPDDTEYFIRTLLDRPPDVRVVRPAGDKQVTPLEEVTIEARADDDFGVQSFDLVLQKPGNAEVIVPLPGPKGGLTVNGAHTLYLEDLEVAPGDIVSYYVRARDIGRGKPASESRSDIFFLEVKAFNDEFVAAQSQAMSAGGQAQGVQDLAAAQKEIVVATWKLNSRGVKARSAGSAADIKTLADAQRALEERAAKEAGNQLQGAGAPTPRRRRPGPATLNTVSEDPLGLAIEAMRRAIGELDRRQTEAALPHEMEALNQLLRAESDVQRRQVARQQSGGGGNGNRESPDLSALFDQELRQQQETNYETPASSETRQDTRKDDDPLAKLRELARRQEALSREQQDLARQQAALDAETIKRRLERLTREQEELRRQLEQLAREMPERNQSSQGQRSAQSTPQNGQPGESQSRGQTSSSGQSAGQSSGQSSGSQGKAGQPGQSGQNSGAPQDERQAMRDAMSEMRDASSDLREQDAAGASQSAARALERMRRAEDALRGSTADDLRRRTGDLQLEARQLADAQRRLNDDVARAAGEGGGAGSARSGRGRQLAGEQQRLAERTERLRQRMRDLSQQARGNDGRETLDRAGQELESGRASQLMREAARALEGSAAGAEARPGTASPRQGGGRPEAGTAESSREANANSGGRSGPQGATADAARLGSDAARALDRVAERLDGRRTADGANAARLSDDLSRTRDLRDRLDAVERSLEQLRAREAAARSAQNGARGEAGDASRQAPGSGQPRGGSGPDGETARLQRQLADDMRQAREQVEALGGSTGDMRSPSTPESWQPSVSAPGTEAFKQDFARWESLKQHLRLALEKVERGLADELRQQDAKDRLNAGASEAVPDDYRRLVEKYYRSLAAPRRPER